MNEHAFEIGIGLLAIGLLCIPLIYRKSNDILKGIGMTICAIAAIGSIFFSIISTNPRHVPPRTCSLRAQTAQKLLAGQEVSLQDWVNSYPSGAFPAAIEVVRLELKLTPKQVEQLKKLDNYVVSMRLNPTNIAK